MNRKNLAILLLMLLVYVVGVSSGYRAGEINTLNDIRGMVCQDGDVHRWQIQDQQYDLIPYDEDDTPEGWSVSCNEKGQIVIEQIEDGPKIIVVDGKFQTTQ